ncbi:MAG: glycosyltransferase family 2 protein [Bacteroidota bacterium]
MSDSLSIFMPFYNDAGTVEFMVDSAYKYGGELASDLEVIAVNDGSADHTLQVLQKLRSKHPSLKIISHEHNRGYGGALISGINHTTKNWVFYTDGDAQYHLDDLKSMWLLKDSSDVVNGYKLSRSDNVVRKAVGSSYSLALKLIFSTPIRDIDCDFRLMRGDMVRSLNLACTSGAITVELIKKLQQKNAKFSQVGVSHYNRIYGQSAFFTTANILKTFKDEFKLLKEFKSGLGK